jgi:hypothetical protein
MNEFEQERQPLLPPEADSSSDETDIEILSEQKEHTSDTLPSDAANDPTNMPRLAPLKRAPRRNIRPGPGKTKSFRQFVSIGWSGAREPATDLIWAEAHLDGNWIVVDALDRIRTRKEILDRILDLQAALVTLDFNFSYPTEFFDLLRETEGIGDWRAMLRTIRADVKKNVDDGLRLWAERMGRYRESRLDPEVPRTKLQRTHRYDDWGWGGNQKNLAPHEQLSMARRFRHTDVPLRNAAGTETMSTMQIGFNQLTGRYEFNGNIRGRPALLGMAMLEQLLEADRKDLAIWPMMEPRALTIAEGLPWLLTEGHLPEPSELENVFDNYEDAGWEIPDGVRAYARKNQAARQALFTVMGIVKIEQRLSRKYRPIRDYNFAMYRDPRVQKEGWIYGVGYRPHTEEEDSRIIRSEHVKPEHERSDRARTPAVVGPETGFSQPVSEQAVEE